MAPGCWSLLGYPEMNGRGLQRGSQGEGLTGCKGREQHKQVGLRRRSCIILEYFYFM